MPVPLGSTSEGDVREGGMIMVDTRTSDEVLHEIEQDLRRDEDLWKHIHSNLRTLEVPPARGRRRRLIVAGTVASVVALFAAFGLGWQLGPTTTEEIVATEYVTVGHAPGIPDDKYEVLRRLHVVPAVAPVPVPETEPPPGIAEDEFRTIAQMHGVPQAWLRSVDPNGPMNPGR